jgi:hypothetical protein
MGKECSRHYGKAPLAAALDIAHGLGVPLCTHVSDPDFPAGELAEMMGEGDIFTHTYQGRGNTIISDGSVDKRILRARERGVLFDVGDARVHLDFEVFKTALREGFVPDLIGSDITDRGAFDKGVFALPLTLSKLISLGMDEAAVLRSAMKMRDSLLHCLGQEPYRRENCSLLGPAACPVPKINYHFRYRLMLRCALDQPLRQLLAHLMRQFFADKSNRGISCFADVNGFD